MRVVWAASICGAATADSFCTPNATHVEVVMSPTHSECRPIAEVFLTADGEEAFVDKWDLVRLSGVPLEISEEAAVCSDLTSSTKRRGTDNAWVFTSGVRVLSMQGGFGLLESSQVRTVNAVNIMMKNMLDLLLGGIAYFFVGYYLAYGEGGNSFMGSLSAPFSDPTFFIFQWSFAATAATIDSGALAERVDLITYIALSTVTTGLVYPIVAHWVWASDGWLYQEGYIDLAGSTVVHAVGGTSALMATLCVGPRICRYPNYKGFKSWFLRKFFLEAHHENYYRGLFSEIEVEIAEVNIGSRNPSQCLFGTFLLWVGWYSFNCGSTLAVSGTSADAVGGVAVTTTLSASFAGFVGCIYDAIVHYRKAGYAVLKADTMCNTVLAGLVGITAGCSSVTYFGAVMIGLGSSLTYLLARYMERQFQIDDVIGAFPVHGSAGMAGTLLLGFFATDRPFGGIPCGVAVPKHLGWFYGGDGTLLWIQLKGVVAIFAWTAVLTMVVMHVMNCIRPIRACRSAELIGLDMVEHAFFDPDDLKTNARLAEMDELEVEFAHRPADFYETSEMIEDTVPRRRIKRVSSILFGVNHSTLGAGGPAADFSVPKPGVGGSPSRECRGGGDIAPALSTVLEENALKDAAAGAPPPVGVVRTRTLPTTNRTSTLG
mmetsp:Transcript_64310/g.172157  ORF Transcript_64310/g.172157 Transcript_64310/m.172157 type:complete len:657 (+) Transcript_64310:32-2002(+)